jgi:hypothetical protein
MYWYKNAIICFGKAEKECFVLAEVLSMIWIRHTACDMELLAGARKAVPPKQKLSALSTLDADIEAIGAAAVDAKAHATRAAESLRNPDLANEPALFFKARVGACVRDALVEVCGGRAKPSQRQLCW